MPKFYTASELAKVANVSLPTVYNWINTGRVAGVVIPEKNGKRKTYRIPEEVFDQFRDAKIKAKAEKVASNTSKSELKKLKADEPTENSLVTKSTTALLQVILVDDTIGTLEISPSPYGVMYKRRLTVSEFPSKNSDFANRRPIAVAKLDTVKSLSIDKKMVGGSIHSWSVILDFGGGSKLDINGIVSRRDASEILAFLSKHI